MIQRRLGLSVMVVWELEQTEKRFKCKNASKYISKIYGYRLINGFRLLLVLISSFTSFSCGYFDNDKIEYQKGVTRNITIQKQENDNSNNLVFEETNTVSAVILNNCVKIYYDSLDRKIYVETSHNKVDEEYWQIKILNSSAQYVSEAIQKKVITKESFDGKTKKVLMKWELKK